MTDTPMTVEELVELMAREAYAHEVAGYDKWFWTKFREQDPDGYPTFDKVHPKVGEKLLDRQRAVLVKLEAAGLAVVPVEATVEQLIAMRKQLMQDMAGSHMGPSAFNTYSAAIAAGAIRVKT